MLNAPLIPDPITDARPLAVFIARFPRCINSTPRFAAPFQKREPLSYLVFAEAARRTPRCICFSAAAVAFL